MGLENSFHNRREHPHVSRAGRFGKAHLEPPLNSFVYWKACRTLHHGSVGGPDHHSLIHGATMQRC
jgi:hypothetical protein